MGRDMNRHFQEDGYLDALSWRGAHATRAGEPVPERVVQQLWYDRTWEAGELQTAEGHRREVGSPGWGG